MSEKTVTIKGMGKVTKAIKQLAKDYPYATTAALYQEAAIIFEESQIEVPVSTGNLRQTGLLTVHKSGHGYKVLVGYGAAYALKIHEATEYDENRKDPYDESYTGDATVGKSKFLEDPFNRAMGGIEDRLAKRVARFLEGGPVEAPETLPDIKGSQGKGQKKEGEK